MKKEFKLVIETEKFGYRSYRKVYKLYDKEGDLIIESGDFEKNVMPIILHAK